MNSALSFTASYLSAKRHRGLTYHVQRVCGAVIIYPALHTTKVGAIRYIAVGRSIPVVQR